MPRAIITLLTDFGYDDAYVGLMKGVILGINPDVQLVDLTHAVPPQDVLRAALILRSALPHFPPGTIHVAVVDPGVGSARRPLLLHTPAGLLIGPDNGVLSLAAREAGDHTPYVLDRDRFFRQPVSQTFHGRDVFAPIAAHASLEVAPEELGSPGDSIVELDVRAPRVTAAEVRGEVIYVDRFGNLVTNIDSATLAAFRGRALSVSIGAIMVAGPVAAYAAVEEGTPVALLGSWNTLEVAVRNGNAASQLGARAGTHVSVTAKDSVS
jgi:S-adenosylmethionine hydrolase